MWAWLEQIFGGAPKPPAAKPSPEETTVYIDSALGNDATGQRGNKTKPFKTIDAGIAAAKSGDTVSIAEGMYPVK